MARNRVLLPEPDAPMISTRSPGSTSAVASSMMTLPSFIAIERFSKLSQPFGCGDDLDRPVLRDQRVEIERVAR